MDYAKMFIRIIARGRVIEVVSGDIRYIESKEHNCMIHMENGMIETGASMTLTTLEALLPSPQFIRCHNSFIVNLGHVVSVKKTFVLRSGEEVLISRIGFSKWKELAYNYNGWSIDEAEKKKTPASLDEADAGISEHGAHDETVAIDETAELDKSDETNIPD